MALPLNDPTNEELFANLEKVRAKFKQVEYLKKKILSLHCIIYLIVRN